VLQSELEFDFGTCTAIAEPVHHLQLVQVRLALGAETAPVPRIVIVAAVYAMAYVAAGVRAGAGEVAAVRLADRRTGLHRETVVCAEWTPSSCAHFDPFAPAGRRARAHEFAIDASRAEG
jgi:hypothetical protein